ncbi:MAG: hypothetical protein WAS73_16855 [Defluviicoccus sp.]
MTMTILPTTNETWGFWGSMGYTTADQSQAWALAATAIAKATSGTPEAVRHATTASPLLNADRRLRDVLDSRQGRHFADDVANGLFAGRTLAAAVDAAVATWMAWRIDKQTEREHGIPSGLPYLTGWVIHHQLEAEMTE